jgi:peptidyl-prolyl cis-trans isomerase SurA
LSAGIRTVVAAIILASTLSWAGAPGAAPGVELDRLIAAVNGKVLTELDLQISLRLKAFMLAGSDPKELSREEAINRLIDQELMNQEVRNFPLIAEDESNLARQIQELRKTYEPAAGTLEAIASQYGLSEGDVTSYVKTQAAILRYIDFRFRLFATISEPEVEGYYREKLLPRLAEMKSPVPQLSEVSTKIQEILREEKVNAAVEEWISDLRRHARIEYFHEAGVPSFSK